MSSKTWNVSKKRPKMSILHNFLNLQKKYKNTYQKIKKVGLTFYKKINLSNIVANSVLKCYIISIKAMCKFANCLITSED